jgi:hypothetical protein
MKHMEFCADITVHGLSTIYMCSVIILPEKPVVPLTAEEKLERELRRKKRLEKKREEMEKKRILLEKAKEAKQQGREAGGRAKVDHRYYAVRSLRGARPAGRELNRQAVSDKTVEKTIGHVLEEGFLGGGDERWLRNYNIHKLDRLLLHLQGGASQGHPGPEWRGCGVCGFGSIISG